mgnify:CR=1 FL=1
MIEKSELRKKFRALRSELPGHGDYMYLLDVPEIQTAKIISSYYPLPGEPNLISLNDALIKLRKTVLLPRIINQQMEFAKYEGHESQLVARGKFHEPSGNIFIGLPSSCSSPRNCFISYTLKSNTTTRSSSISRRSCNTKFNIFISYL